MAECHSYHPIGHIKSIFETKNGTLRQSGLSEYARASLTINKTIFTNPDHSLENLSQFSHLWLVWVFHQNQGSAVKAKVSPPRLGGERVGVFSTRSPHRPANIGLTLARLERVQGDTVHMSGVDMVDGTPVLDIKPYIPQYDAPHNRTVSEKDVELSTKADEAGAEEVIEQTETKVPKWVGDPEENLSVIFSSRAEKDLEKIDISKFKWLKSRTEMRSAVRDVLSSDPRSVYRKTKCSDRMYFTSLDTVHVTAWYDPDIDGMEVLRMKQEI
eukprot:GFUD01010949.1.p1 GENE.GFUD01010949.1~~GFUD01010949.1.p1  ORF type:complete len:271 (-),score=112.35 GFUD01010949.1:444-1256(-)